MIIGIDVDGVLAHFDGDFSKYIVKVLNINHWPADGPVVDVWDWPQKYGYTDAEMGKVWKVLKQDQHFWEALPAFPWTKDLLTELRFAQKRGHDVYFITNRPSQSSKAQTEHWLNRHGFNFPTVLVASNKGLAAKLLALDWYADDKTENCVDTAPYCYTVMVEQPWNQLPADSTIHRFPATELAPMVKGF